MPKGIYKRKTKRKTRGPNRTVLYLYRNTLYTRAELDESELSNGDVVYECIGKFTINRGPVNLKSAEFTAD